MNRARGIVAACLAAVGITFAAMFLATRLAPPGAPALRGGLGNLLDSIGRTGALRFAPLSPRILGDVLAPAPTILISNVGRAAGAPSHPAPEPPPALRGGSGWIPGLAPGHWTLTLTMVADRATVKAGDDILYRMIVRNVGSGDFSGQSLTLQWHTPLGTVGSFPGRCERVPRDDVQRTCGSVLIPFPGLGDSVHEETDTAGLLTIKTSQEWVQEWRVHTDPGLPQGTRFDNHAHLRVAGQPGIITTPTITVTVE